MLPLIRWIKDLQIFQVSVHCSGAWGEVCCPLCHLSAKCLVLIAAGIKDTIPELTDYGYEGFDSLTEKTNCWLVNQPPSMTVINMQSVMVMMSEGKRFSLSKVYEKVQQSDLCSIPSQYPLLICCHPFSPTNHLLIENHRSLIQIWINPAIRIGIRDDF